MTQTTNSFAAWMLATYNDSDLDGIATHGCASYAPAGMIYYTENVALFEQYKDDLFEIMADYQDAIDAPETLITALVAAMEHFTADLIALLSACA